MLSKIMITTLVIGLFVVTSVFAIPYMNNIYTQSNQRQAEITTTPTTTPTTITVESSKNPSASGRQVTFTATISPNTATGQVTFTDTSTRPPATLGIGSLSGGIVTFSISTLAVGSHQITATYSGDTSDAGSTSNAMTQTVKAVIITTTSLESSLNPSTVGQPVTFTARVSPSSATGTVLFTINGINAGSPVTLSGGTATIIISSFTVGMHYVNATYSGDTDNTPSTDTLTQTVNQITSSITVSSSQNPSTVGQPLTFTATVTPSTVTGTVNFFEGTQLLATSTISDGTAVFTTSAFNAGSHSITASYSGDTNNAQNTSVTLTQTVNAPPLPASKRIAIVQPTFTEAAYNNAFYVFYHKYDSYSPNAKVRTDLNLLTAQLGNIATNSAIDNKAMASLRNHIVDVSPDATIANLADQDVEDGRIFSNSTKNAYDVLVLLHEEYVTQNMYDEYKRFVSEGGKIIFVDSNFFYAEVSHDKNANTITLVKGHGWDFNGTVAKKGIIERWLNETKEWVGSNYLPIPVSQKVLFSNNVFDYTHHEENFVDNPNDSILLDYGAYTQSPATLEGKIASYELKYGAGKVIVTGLYGQDISENSVFILFFDSLVKEILSEYPSSNYQIPAGIENTTNIPPTHPVQGISVPSVPTSLTAYATSSTSIRLSWDPPQSDGGSAITGYMIEYSNGTSQYLVLVANTGNSQTTYLHTGLVTGTTYTYRVSAINSIGAGPPSITTSAKPQYTNTPRITSAVAISPTEVSLSWIPPTQTYGQAITGYKIDQIIGGVNISVVDNTGSIQTSYTVSGLTPEKKYTFEVTALFSEGNSPPSPPVSVITSGD